MPCEGGGPSHDYRTKLNNVTDMLCRTLQTLEKAETPVLQALPQDVQDWWEEHRAVDLQRCAQRLRAHIMDDDPSIKEELERLIELAQAGVDLS